MNGELAPESDAMFSLVSGEGEGFMLGVAAGDSAGGAWELGYSAVTEQVTVIAYELIQNRQIDSTRLTKALRELDGSEEGERVYRAETPHFRAWLDRAAAGYPMPEEEPSLDSVVRTAPLGVAFRSDPRKVTWEAVELARIFDADVGSIAAATISAAAVAASCFGQSGRDLIAGVAESVVPVLPVIGGDAGDDPRLHHLEQTFQLLLGSVGVATATEALGHVHGEEGDPLRLMLAGLLLAAPVSERAHTPIEQAARIGGSTLGAAVGAILGARSGIRAWPWAFANDTWFAEIGRRVTNGPDEVRDLPIPYAVEQHLITGSHPGFH